MLTQAKPTQLLIKQCLVGDERQLYVRIGSLASVNMNYDGDPERFSSIRLLKSNQSIPIINH